MSFKRLLLPAALAALAVLSESPLALASRNVTRLQYSAQEIPSSNFTYTGFSSLALPREKCPPCFNCRLPRFKCGQYGECDPYDGQCKCPPGWGGIDCLVPQCDSLADGDKRRLREDGKQCECKEGWKGVNCNVCQSDRSCKGFPLRGQPTTTHFDGDDEDDLEGMLCYNGGETVFNNHQFCNVTNRKILDMLPDRPPQVTFSCDRESATCDFQFWTAQVESFYCALDTCKSSRKVGFDQNTTLYECDNIKCSCVSGRFICGEDGSVDISDFLTEEIKGPATFSCRSDAECRFEEPAMNQLINDIFGDGYITLTCGGGECLHFSQVPGYVSPPKPDSTRWIALSIAGAGLVMVFSTIVFWYAGRAGSGDFGGIKLPGSEAAKLMADHVPASLHFSGVSYTLGNRKILDGISGRVKSGQVMAIMGASGAGKSTFLDILARKNKRGSITGTTLVNGREVSDNEFRKVVGYVDQEDTLMPTLTAYETVLYSALLRLPREMSYEAKKYRTLETMQELGILGIKDMTIGSSGHRSISGGEKRRVSIACELVTSPSILFLDEPTSGLDAYNAYNVVESLASLARDYNRTVVFTIHQPRSNIVAMFDHLILLAQGKTVFSGEFSKCQDYLERIGQPCPPGFNIADYLIDLTMKAAPPPEAAGASSEPDSPGAATNDNTFRDEENGLGHQLSVRPPSGDPSAPGSFDLATGYFKRKTSQLMDAVSLSSHRTDGPALTPELATLVETYASSDIAEGIKNEIEEVRASAHPDANGTGSEGGETRDVAFESSLLRGRKRASWGTQFRILSGRAFKNLYRDPALLAAHYISSVALALLCGLFYHNVPNTIGGFQNRLGVFFFILALFGFSSLTTLGLFANERVLFMRERSNGYYSSFTYFSSKLLFDILPLRVVPPLLFGGIVYGLIGLVPEVAVYWKFMLTLVLFNLATATAVLLVSIIFESTSVASLVGTLLMLYNLLFTGLLINKDILGPSLQWLLTTSFFHAAYEALAVNELKYLQLRETKFGVEIDVPAATILSMFGFRAQAFWWPDIGSLGIFIAIFTIASYLALHFWVTEKR